MSALTIGQLEKILTYMAEDWLWVSFHSWLCPCVWNASICAALVHTCHMQGRVPAETGEPLGSTAILWAHSVSLICCTFPTRDVAEPVHSAFQSPAIALVMLSSWLLPVGSSWDVSEWPRTANVASGSPFVHLKMMLTLNTAVTVCNFWRDCLWSWNALSLDPSHSLYSTHQSGAHWFSESWVLASEHSFDWHWLCPDQPFELETQLTKSSRS